MSLAEIISVAREMIATPDKWTQNAWSRDDRGHKCGLRSPFAVSRCAVCAILEAGGPDSIISVEADSLLKEAFEGNLELRNDQMTHAEVIAAMVKAEQLAMERGL